MEWTIASILVKNILHSPPAIQSMALPTASIPLYERFWIARGMEAAPPGAVHPYFSIVAIALAGLLTGCATDLERRSDRDLHSVSHAQARLHSTTSSPTPGGIDPEELDGTLGSYVQYAMNHSPVLRASFEDWRASAKRISRSRRLPEPVITYGYFVRRVETRVGPQRHRIGLSQSFPWPTKLTAGADSASLAARGAQRRYEVVALELTRKIAEAYWRLWLIDRSRVVHRDQKRLLEHFSALVRGRVEVGQATLADLGQIDLSVSRLTDTLAGLDEQEQVARAALVAAVGAPPGTKTTILADAPPLTLYAEPEEALLSSALEHPRVRVFGLMAESQLHRSRAAGADAYPSFTLGVDYIETGPAQMPGVADSGKDAVVAMVGAKLPLWGGSYQAEQEEARAEGQAHRAREAAARDQAAADLQKAMSEVRDAARRAKLHRDTLLPQAETVYTSGLGAYQVGRSSLASVILAQRELIDIQLAFDRALADHALAWARLEEVVGRPVKSRSAP